MKMPRKKDVAIKPRLNQKKSVSFTAENEYENKDKSTTSVKRKKQCAPQSGKKGKEISQFTISAPCHSGEEIQSHVVSSSKKRGKKITATKTLQNTKQKLFKDENDTNKEGKRKRQCNQKSNRKGNEQSLSKMAVNVQSTKEISKKPQRKNSSTNGRRNKNNEKILPTESNRNENDKNDTNSVKNKKQCISRSRKKIKEDDLPTHVAHLNFWEENMSPTVSVSIKKRKQLSTIKNPRSKNRGTTLNEKQKDNIFGKDKCSLKKNQCLKRSIKKEMSALTPQDGPFVFAASPSVSPTQPRSNRTISKVTSAVSLPENKKRSGSSGKENKTCVQRCRKKSKVELISEDLSTFKCSAAALPAKNSTNKGIKIKGQHNSRKRKLSTEHGYPEQDRKKNKSFRNKKWRLQSGDGNEIEKLIEELVLTSAQDVPSCPATKKTSACVSFMNSPSTYHEVPETSIGVNAAGREVSAVSTVDLSFPIVNIIASASSIGQTVISKEFPETRCIDSQCASKNTVLSAIDVPFYSENESAHSIASSLNPKSDNGRVQEIKCMICFDLETFSDFVTLSCDHSFHTFCLKTWYQVKKSCPVCNPEISLSNDSIEAFNDINRYENINVITNEVKEFQHADNNIKIVIDTHEFPNVCVICKEPSIFFEFNYLNDRFPDFRLLPCGHNVHISCANIFIDTCPECGTNSIIEDDGFYEFPEEVRCVICLDTAEYSDFEYISCYHSFHCQCIKTWFSVRRDEICPVCMTNNSMNATQDESVYGFLEGVKCAICMDIEESSEFTQLSCRHNVHTNCAQASFDEKTYCPTCMKHVYLKSFEANEEDTRCIICVDTEEYPDFEFLPCAHSFHTVCIQSWLKKRKSCPTCNTPVLNNPYLTGNARYACI